MEIRHEKASQFTKAVSLNMAKEQGFEPYATKPKSLHLQFTMD